MYFSVMMSFILEEAQPGHCRITNGFLVFFYACLAVIVGMVRTPHVKVWLRVRVCVCQIYVHVYNTFFYFYL